LTQLSVISFARRLPGEYANEVS